MLLRNILSAPRSTPRPLLYLELGCIPIRFILKTRRLMYLKYILDEDEQSLIHSVFQAQVNSPLKGDWCTSVNKDLEDLKLSKLTYNSIKDMTKARFKSQVNDAVVSASLTYLLNWKTNMTKISHIQYQKLEIQPYLMSSLFANKESEFLCNARGWMLDVKSNYRGSYKEFTCPLKCDQKNFDTQIHLLSCEKIQQQDIQTTNNTYTYEDLFIDDINKQLFVTRILIKKMSLRKKLLEEST